MNNIDSKTEDEIREFLLGRMGSAEREAFETRVVRDANLFENTEAIEQDLIDQYVRDALSDSERDDFERHLMATKRGRDRVAFARTLRARLVAVKDENGERAGFLTWILRPRFALAFGVLAVLVVAAVVLLRNGARDDLKAEATSPTPTSTAVSPTPAPSVNVPNLPDDNDRNVNAASDNTKRPPVISSTPTPSPSRQLTATLALLVPTIRGGGGNSELKLTGETTGANFELGLDSRDYKVYRAEIVDAEGRTIYRSGKLTPRGTRLNVYFPTARLKNDDYLIRVNGVNESGVEESAADFQFRVVRR